MKIENFEGFFRKYEKFSVKIAYRALRNKENAEDVCQDVFIHFYKILDYLDLSNEKMLESLIYTATINAEILSKNPGESGNLIWQKRRCLNSGMKRVIRQG